MTTEPLRLRKHLTKLSADELALVDELSRLDPSGLNETAIREQFLAPLVRLLGYRISSEYQVLYEDTFKASDWYVMYGRKKIKLDYRFVVWKQGFWLLEAKPGPPRNNPTAGFSAEDAQQAYSYSTHPDIDALLFAVSNGAVTEIYDRDKEGLEPIFSVKLKDLPAQINRLREYLAADQVQFYLKRKLLRRIEQVLGSELVLSRPDEFVEAVRRVAHRVQPRVFENFRANAADGKSLEDRWDELASGSRPCEIIGTFFIQQMSQGQSLKLCERVADGVQPKGNYLFFARLLLEDLRPVTIHYHHNTLYLLGVLATRGVASEYIPPALRANGKTTVSTAELFHWWLDLLVTGFRSWPELRTLWLVEGVAGRIAKQLLLLPPERRAAIDQQSALAQYLLPEAELGRSGTAPAHFMIAAIEGAVVAAVSEFLAKYYDANTRTFKVALAGQEYTGLLAFEEHLNASSTDFEAIKKELGTAWSELIGYDSINISYDLLASGALNIALNFTALRSGVSAQVLTEALELAALNHAAAEDFCRDSGAAIAPLSGEQARDALSKRFQR